MMEAKMQHYVARDGKRVSEMFDTALEAVAFVRSSGSTMAFNMAVRGLSFCIRADVNTWGTEDAEEIAYIENARYDSWEDRKRSNEIFVRVLSSGVSPEDARTYVENGGK